MRYRAFLIGLILMFASEIFALILYMNVNGDGFQDTVEINEAVQSVQADFDNLELHRSSVRLNYTVLDGEGKILFRTKPGLSESINEAISHRDTILDIEREGAAVGKIIIFNDSAQRFADNKRKIVLIFAAAAVFQILMCSVYSVYLNRTVIKPFHKLKRFAKSVAGGNLDIPLEMDRENIFGSFTESFDIMRSELKKARLAEAKANADKKELVAKLSHDIRTPVASIKAASEVGAAVAESEKTRRNYDHIIHKADQINTLVTNLFSAALEDLQQLTVEPADMDSGELLEMLTEADYLHYGEIRQIPRCLIYADKLRLQQVFDNIFANSYKYANTEINIDISLRGKYLAVCIEDHGGGVNDKELTYIKEKFKRGNNSSNIEGAGLGLYISDCFMKEMRGELLVENGDRGLCVTVLIALSGNI